MKVLELFSGIGGMRTGISLFSSENEFISVDLNQACNEIFKDSFGDTPFALDICSLSVEWFVKTAAQIWTMSPPCQPYTRQGLQKDMQDERAKPLIHICSVLERFPEEQLPKLILLENVKNFEQSDSFLKLKSVLELRGYSLFGYLINPLYMGFPNSRLRFFLVAKRCSIPEPFKIKSNDPESDLFHPDLMFSNKQRTVGDFLCPFHSSSNLDVSDHVLNKRAAFCFDVVAARSRQSLCFTRSYTKFIDGTGSVLYTGEDCEWDDKGRPIFNHITCMSELKGKLRYFCPVEAAKLNGFPSLRIRNGCDGGKRYYRAIGNSLNPQVVAHLMEMHPIVE